MKKTVAGEPLVGLQPETPGGHAPTKAGPISTIAAALHRLVRPQTRSKIMAETSAETGRATRPERDFGASRPPMDAGVTGGFSLLVGGSHARKRR